MANKDTLDHLTTDKKIYVHCPRCRRAVHYKKYYVNGKRQSYCDECRAVPEETLCAEMAAQSAAKTAMAVAYKRGEFKIGKRCIVCKAMGSHDDRSYLPNRRSVMAHHHDYSKPLDVIWLCSKHHFAWHRLFIVTR